MNPLPALPLPGLAGFAHRWVDGIHAVDGGQPAGPAVVLLAGFPQTWWAWRKTMPALAERFRVLAIDLPGQGHSARPYDSYDTHTVASRVQAAVTALDVPQYWLAAHDIGAWVAFSLALQHEERLHGVALLDAGIPGVTLPESIPTDHRAWKTWHFAFHLVPDLPETLLTGRERDYVDWFLKAKSRSPFRRCGGQPLRRRDRRRGRAPRVPRLLPRCRGISTREPRRSRPAAPDRARPRNLQLPWIDPRHGRFPPPLGGRRDRRRHP
ncbi:MULTISPECIES: alpha/beta fold hydrolase [Amycolatopsis]|uniref:alpha/beta fold hydrolase n=1 Tax=Amycolatopsis TaxID=1813 RepID=UPI0007E1D149|nr:MULTISPECIES: alpha/beta hydrolase [Amycolatopsis]OAP21686.1 Fluoroacetate dehalogenase [Amycolatopsis sp. M39]